METDISVPENASIYQAMSQINADDTSDWRSNTIEDFSQSMLFSEWDLGSIHLHHRMVKSAAGSLFLPGMSDERTIDDYVRLVHNGCEFVWVENYANLTQHFPSNFQVRDRSNAHLEELTAAIHEAGGYCGYQIYLMCADFSGFDNTNAAQFECATADDLTYDEIHLLRDSFIEQAEYLKSCGFDAIEFNCAGNNIGQTFLSRNRNHRNDEYGPQNFENRSRFVCEVVQGIKASCGADFPVQILINGVEANDVNIGQDAELTTVEETCEIAKQLEAAGADSLQVRLGPWGYHPCEFAGDLYFSGYGISGSNTWGTRFDFDRHFEGLVDGHHSGCGLTINVAAKVKQAVSIPVGTVTYMDPAHAPDMFEKALEDGKLDFIEMTREFYADPEYIVKLREGRISEIRPCNRCLHCHFDTDENGAFYEHCRTNATHMRAFTDEMPEGPDLPALEGGPKKVLVAGGGPAGMEAARVAAERGHSVTLYEKAGILGGLLPFAAAVKGSHENIADFNQWLQDQLDLNGVTVLTGTEVTADLVRQEAPDVVIDATGGVTVSTGLLSTDGTSVVPLMDFATAEIGDDVAIVGHCAPAVDIAFRLLAEGKRVTIVMDAPLGKLDSGQSSHVKDVVLPALYATGARVIPNAAVKEVGDGTITVAAADNGCDIPIACDTVIEALDFEANTALSDALASEFEVVVVGNAKYDPAKPHNIAEAIANGNMAARAL